LGHVFQYHSSAFDCRAAISAACPSCVARKYCSFAQVLKTEYLQNLATEYSIHKVGATDTENSNPVSSKIKNACRSLLFPLFGYRLYQPSFVFAVLNLISLYGYSSVRKG